jgi:glucose-1-phosphate thymidylyltransferase
MFKIKTAILLLGGKGFRLTPLTLLVNKHMLPIYDRSLAQIALDFLYKLGIKRIIAVINQEDAVRYRRLFALYRKKLEIDYVFQDPPQGTAHAIKLCESKLDNERYFVTYWGDNVFEFVDKKLLQTGLGSYRARIHIARVEDPKNYGVVEIKNRNIVSIEEKPKKPKSDDVCAGFMIFHGSVFREIDKTFKNSGQEWDIMDVIRKFCEEGVLDYLEIKGKWFDAGVSIDSLFKTSEFARRYKINKTSA